jgi:hypothetical protein
MRTFDLGEVIAERRLTFEAEAGWSRDVDVRIGRPIPDPSEPNHAWVCPYQVFGLGRDRVMGIFGADAMQALLLAIHTLPAELAAFMREPGGRFLDHKQLDTSFLTGCRTALECVGDVYRPDEREHVASKAVDTSSDLFFLNVDLDVDSADDLTLLVQAFEPSAFALERPAGRASFELNNPASPRNPESLILEFARVVNDLPSPAREIWDRASRRVFDIGMQSGRQPFHATHRLAPATLRAVASVDGEIAVTVYALLPEDEAG